MQFIEVRIWPIDLDRVAAILDGLGG